MRAKEPIKKLCDYCGKEFQASRQDTLYCSHSCNRKAYRETKRKEVVALTETLVSKKQIEKTVVSLSDREYLSISEVAALTGVSRWTIYRYAANGIIPAKRISQRTTLIRKKDIESLFDEVEPYEVLQTGERKPIDEWYTLDDITEKYGLLRHRIRKIINTEGITTKKDGTRTLIAKGKIDAYFRKKGIRFSILHTKEES